MSIAQSVRSRLDLRRRFWLRRPMLRLAIARRLGRGLRLARRYGPTLVLLLVVAVLGWWLADVLIAEELGSPKPSWTEFWNTLLLALGIWLLVWVMRARRRLVIADFGDHRAVGSDPDDENAPGHTAIAGLAPLLAIELSKLARLFRAVDEQRAVSTLASGKSHQVAAGPVAELGDRLFQDAVSAEHKLSVGPLTIPVGAAMGLVTRLAQGPRIAGHVYGDETSIMITARMNGRGGPYTWRVDQSCGPGVELHDTNKAVAELACRIFADLALEGRVRWQATWSFAQGLEAYRDSLNTSQEKRSKLRDAERHFIQAISEDQGFDQAKHNLGVVYLELQDPENPEPAYRAAEQVFRGAVVAHPDRVESYYGLAQTRLEVELARGAVATEPQQELAYRTIAEHCQRVISGGVDRELRANAYTLRGGAERLADMSAGLEETKRPTRSRRRAVRIAVRAHARSLLRSAGGGDAPVRSTAFLAARCLDGLGAELSYRAEAGGATAVARSFRRWRAEVALRRALAIVPANPLLHARLGNVTRSAGRWRKAYAAYRSAVELAPDNVSLRADVAQVLAELGEASASRRACALALACPSALPAEVLAVVERAFRTLGTEADVARADRVHRMLPLLSALRSEEKLLAMPDERDAAHARLREQAGEHAAAGRDWEFAQVSMSLAFNDPDATPREAVEHLEAAIEALEPRYPEEIKRHGLRARLAGLLFAEGKADDALAQAARAQALDPVNVYERRVVADLYFRLKQYEAAREALEVALLMNPEDVTLHSRLGEIGIVLADARPPGSERATLVRRAREHLTQAFALEPASPERAKSRAYALSLRAGICLSTGEPSAALGDLWVAAALEPKSLLRRHELGAAHLANKGYDEAREEFQAVLDGATGEPPVPLDAVFEPDDWGNAVTRAELVVRARLGLARTYGDRDVAFDTALEHVEKGLEALPEVPEERAREQGLEAALLAYKGWLLRKRGEIEEAIELLEQGLSLKTDAETYAQLGRAYLAKGRTVPMPHRDAWVSRARACARHAEDADTWSVNREERDALEGELAAL